MILQQRRLLRRTGIILSITLTPLVLLAAILIAYQSNAWASSHREAPLISKDAYADNTDTYVFISPENQNNIVFVGSWIPFEGPEGGPNYFEWDPTALYDIYVDNDGDAKSDITYTLSSRVAVGNDQTFLYNTGPIAALDPANPNWNRKQYITVTEQLEDGTKNILFANKLTTPANIGSKSTPDYTALENQAIQAITTPQGPGKVYAGQTDDPFWVDLQVFDLLTLRGQPSPIGYSAGTNIPVDSVSGFNVHSLVVEVPIAHVTSGGDPVVGMWSGTRRQATRVLGTGTETPSGPYVQVSRLGMPLVNEVVIPYALKDVFNSIPPSADLGAYGLLQKSVEDPEVATLLCLLYGVPVPNPGPASDPVQRCHTQFTAGTPRTGRGDIFDIFVTGIKLSKPLTINGVTIPAGTNYTQPQSVTPAEMLRINTAIHTLGVCPATPSRLGVLGGDLCGFPNGRRLIDDIVEIELRAVAGEVYALLDGSDTNFEYNVGLPVDLTKVLDDGIDYNDVPFRGAAKVGDPPTQFPYLAQAQSGQQHWHTNPYLNLLIPWVQKN